MRRLLRSVRDVVTLVDRHRDEEAVSYIDVEVRNALAALDRECVDAVTCRLQSLVSEYGLDKELADGPVTITYRPDEVIELTRWIWEHRDLIGGMAFLPAFDAHYAQLPYIEISKEEYEQRAATFPEIDFSKIFRYESSDLTTAAQEFACLAGGCDEV